MVKKLTKTAIIGAVLQAGVIPDYADVSPKGARWHENHLVFQWWLESKPDGSLAWSMTIGDEELDQMWKGQGSPSILVSTIGNRSIQWPTMVDGEFESFFLDGSREARSFVRDRADLAKILASDSDVCRGSVYAWLPSGSFVARQVLSLIIARDIGENAIIEEVLEVLHSEKLVPSYDRDVDILAKAREWAKQYSKVLGFKVEL